MALNLLDQQKTSQGEQMYDRSSALKSQAISKQFDETVVDIDQIEFINQMLNVSASKKDKDKQKQYRLTAKNFMKVTLNQMKAEGPEWRSEDESDDSEVLTDRSHQFNYPNSKQSVCK